jgi:energy-coupling factor transporter ATP-binding protein EcfA2
VTLFFADRMIFDAASLRLGHGDRIGLIGPNGSGKTTLLKVIAGEQEVDDGKVTRANGVRIGWLPQDLAISGGRTLIDMILSSVPGRTELDGRLAAAEAELEGAARSGADESAMLDAAADIAELHDLSIPGHPEVFVVGDLARMVMADGTEVPGVAQGALQGGRFVGALIADEVRARTGTSAARPAFRYRDKGNMATVGRAEAVIVTKHFARHGLLAWLLWWAVHIAALVGFRNRVLVMFHWAWSWLTFKRGARLITGPVPALPAVRSIGRDGQVALPPVATAVALDELRPPPP